MSGCTAHGGGLAVLREMTERDLAATARTNGEVLRGHLASINEELGGIFGEVRGMGSLIGVELVRGEPGSASQPGAPIWGKLGAELKTTSLENGLILRADAAGWFALAPAFCATEGELEELAVLLRQSLKDARDRAVRST